MKTQVLTGREREKLGDKEIIKERVRKRRDKKLFWKAKGAFPVVLRSPATGFQTQFQFVFWSSFLCFFVGDEICMKS